MDIAVAMDRPWRSILIFFHIIVASSPPAVPIYTQTFDIAIYLSITLRPPTILSGIVDFS